MPRTLMKMSHIAMIRNKTSRRFRYHDAIDACVLVCFGILHKKISTLIKHRMNHFGFFPKFHHNLCHSIEVLPPAKTDRCDIRKQDGLLLYWQPMMLLECIPLFFLSPTRGTLSAFAALALSTIIPMVHTLLTQQEEFPL